MELEGSNSTNKNKPPGQLVVIQAEQENQKNFIAVAGIFILGAVILFVVISFVVFYYAAPDSQVEGTEILHQPKFATQDRFSCFVASPVEIWERKRNLLNKREQCEEKDKDKDKDKETETETGKENPPSPLIAQVIAPLGTFLSVDKSQMHLQICGMSSMIGLSREKRRSKEFQIPQWMEENKKFFQNRAVKISGKAHNSNFMIQGKILFVRGEKEKNECEILFSSLCCVPEDFTTKYLLELQKLKEDGNENLNSETFPLEELELLFY